ncbi:C25 family cysteine peptidase [Flammeovirga sp. EKP202]|uniref:putative type IX secretion system sortase PorU2 n=1 Tax=Flammeovirga sp. EKP202 TaxID=2770592 RepID=UPI00165EC294|nr:C25 family cysteine peptidase [Flammeovirga sp. EKP202]MBD0404210.1 hypothetical protein [Flammeovirga sp. EKP202]
MRLLLIVTLFFLNLLSVFSQTPVADINAWRDKTRNTTFYKMEVREYGIYRITYTDLLGANYPVGSALLSEIRMFRRGEEVAINIQDNNGNNRFDNGDYLEFYGQPNDGETDRHLFRNTNDFVNPYEPVYSKTAVYFLSSSTLSGSSPLRIQTSNVSSSGATSTDFHWHTETYRDTPTEKSFNFRTSFSQGASANPSFRESDRTSFSSAFRGPRSWTTYNTRNKNQNISELSFQLRINNLYTSLTNDANFKLESKLMNFSARRSGANIRFEIGNTSNSTVPKLDNISISKYETSNNLEIALSNSDFQNSSTHVLLVDQNNGTGSDNNQIGVLYFNLTYPQNHSAISTTSDLSFFLFPDTKKVIAAPENNGGNFYDITSIERPVLLQKNRIGSSDQSIVNNTNGQRVNLYYSSSTKAVTNLSLAEFEFGTNNLDYNYLIISHPALMQPSATYSDPVAAYADYRRTQGGANNVYVADILKLYNTFSWGEQTPLAVRNCIDLLRNQSLEYILILGKGIDLDADPYEKTLSGSRAFHYVPTYGYPGADNAYTMGFDGKEEGIIPVGRIAAHTPQVIENYLFKVQEHESISFDALWRKNALHLSGGADARQQLSFKNTIDDYKDIFIDTLQGGDVQTQSRENEGAVEFIDVSEIINEGVSLMTFLGHSSAQSADIDIGEASDPSKGYQNKGRYPFINMIGCGGGNLFTTSKSWGEDWIETPDKGAIGFMAKSGLGNEDDLRRYGYDFYEAFFQNQVGLPLGYHLLEAQKLMLTSTSIVRQAIVEQTGLQSDPYIKISPSKVDFSVKSDQIIAIGQNGNSINATDDFYKLKITIDNFGHTYYNNKLYIQVNRQYGTGVSSRNTYIDSISAPYYTIDTLISVVNTPEDQQSGNGSNLITVKIGDTLTPSGQVITTIDELNLLNNSATVNVNFFSENVAIIFPQNNAVVHDDQISIYAYDYSIEKSQKDVLFQLATDSAFSNVILTETIDNQEQLFRWNVPLLEITPADTTVYYLRTRLENVSNPNWHTISFTKIKKTSGNGWNQSTIYQMQQNTIDGALLTGNENSLRWDFPIDDAIINVKSGGASYTNGHFYQVQLDGQTYLDDGVCVRSGDSGDKLLFLVFDQENGSFKGAQSFDWEPLQCGEGFPPVAVMFNSNDIRGGNVVGSSPKTRNGPYSLFIDPTYKFQSIVPGDYVLTIMSGNFDFQGDLPTDQSRLDAYHKHLEGFAEIGLDTLDMQANLTQRGLAFIGWSRFQMSPSNSRVFYANSTGELLDQTFTIQRDVKTASVTTPPIGPSKQFSRMWINADLPGPFSQVETTLFGVVQDENGTISTPDSISTFKGISGSNGIDLDSLKELKNYDFISLRTYLMDTSSQRLIPQLYNWRVAYTTVPEGVMISKETDNPEKLQQGQNTTYEYEFHNISSQAFSDSVLVEVNYLSVDNSFSSFVDSIYLPPLPPNTSQNIDITTDSWSKNDPSKRLFGSTNISAVANSDKNQLEIFYNNNNSRTNNIYITSDSINPLIEVLFDGTRIIDGDIISPSANVNISLIDENPFISLEDNLISNNDTIITAFITPQDGATVPVNLASSTTESINNQNHIITNFSISESVPLELLDSDGMLSSGRYLLEVNAKDPSGNNSGYGSTDGKAPRLTIHFEINKEASITNFYPYPNPFSDKVRFVFQVTGVEVPNEMKIQIMTVTGRVVREIFKDELGPIRVGNNITEYAWDGKDEFGDQLANGVYLYRVIIPQKNNGDFKHNSTSSDHMFKHNIGKLYLLR